MIGVQYNVHRLRRSAAALLVLLGLAGVSLPAAADPFVVHSLTTERVDGVYLLNARIEYELTDVLLEALVNGIELVIEVDVEIYRHRDWWLDEEVARVSQRYQLAYYALSRMYVVRNLNTGVQSTFPSLYSALHSIGQMRRFPLIDESLLNPDAAYQARLRTRIVADELPLPLRARAYIDSDWRPASEWYTWDLP